MSGWRRRWARTGWDALRSLVLVFVWFIAFSCGLARYRGESMDVRCVFARPGYTNVYVLEPAGQHVRCEYREELMPTAYRRDITPASSPPTAAHPPEPVTRN